MMALLVVIKAKVKIPYIIPKLYVRIWDAFKVQSPLNLTSDFAKSTIL
jgi:hypothetical protein